MQALKKDGKIELLRFLAILFIMSDHMGHLGLKDLSRPFTGTWVFVEFFLFLSGFLTAKHFDKPQAQLSGSRLESYVTNGVVYTYKKYVRFLPYVTIAVLSEYIVRYYEYLGNHDFYHFYENMQEMPLEILMLSSAGNIGTRLFPLWYLSSSMLVSPFICMVSQIKNKYVKGIIAFYPAVFYYLNRSRSIGAHDYPNQIIRAMCGMLLGVFVYLLSENLKSRTLSKAARGWITFFLTFSFCAILFVSYNGYVHITTYLLLFIAVILLTFSEQSYLPRFSNKLFLYMGKLSMPMYLFHYSLAHWIVLAIPEQYVAAKILVYYIGSILLSMAGLALVNYVSRVRAKRKAVS